MTVIVNGNERELPAGTTIAGLLAALTIASNGTAVAVDGEVVPRARHAETVLPAGAVVEILTAVQGG
jgi:sulfur carrier protein